MDSFNHAMSEDVTIRFTLKMQELLNKALNDGLTFREGAYMLSEIQKHIVHHKREVTLNLPSAASFVQS